MLPDSLPRYLAPAKLNLDLRIVGRLPNGYHALESIFTLIDWCDELCIEPRDDGQIVLHTPTAGVQTQQDLSVRAAKLLQSVSGCHDGADIWLDKQIPMGGGLGGGSSDAATVLWVLNRLWQCSLSRTQLVDLGLQLGADVPFFLFGQTAFARGVGEQLQAFAVPDAWYLVVRPDAHVSTPAVFAHPDLPRNSAVDAHPTWQSRQPLQNDMQAVVLQTHPAVQAAFEVLSAFGVPRMTGSGACLFLSFADEAAAKSVQNALPASLMSRVVRHLPQHPLLENPLLK